MKELQSYKIVLDNSSNVYFAGQTVNGRIEIILLEEIQIPGIYLLIKGAARARWKGKTQSYSGYEEYLKIKHYCLGDENHARITLPIGVYSYPFSFTLPHTLPSSFEGQFGSIRYTIKIVIEGESKLNFEIKTAFTVISQYDLNMFPNLTSPVKVVEEDYPCCCKSLLTTVVMMVPKTGYVCGEKIPVTVEVDNGSGVDAPSVDLTFQQITSYISENPMKLVKEDVIILEKRKLGSVIRNNSKTWTHVILIPPLPPSNLGNSSIIKTDYQVHLEVLQGDGVNKIQLLIPITIGTMPLTGAENRASMSDLPPPDYETSIAENMNPSYSANSANVAIPSVPNQMFGEYRFFQAQSIQDEDDSNYILYNNNVRSFTPQYLVYNFN